MKLLTVSTLLLGSCLSIAVTNTGAFTPLSPRSPSPSIRQKRHVQHSPLVRLPPILRKKTLETQIGMIYDENDSGSDNTDDFMASLTQRMAQVKSEETKSPLVVLDAMVPRQVMKIQVKNPLLINLVRNQLAKETPTFGMLGMAMLNTGERIHLTTGVVVEIMERPIFDDDEGVQLVLRAGKRFRIKGEVENNAAGWTEARVKYLDSTEEEEHEVQNGDDQMAVARAIMKGRELTSPHANMKDNLSLVDRWIELAKENEKEPGQIDRLLEELGEIPAVDEPTERALWVGALINPLPAMGVAMEIRPALLTATSVQKKIEVACDGMYRSIRHMDGSAPMW